MDNSKWKVDDGDDKAASKGNDSEFASTIAKIARGEYVPVNKTYPAFRKTSTDQPNNPSTINTNENYAYDAHFKLSMANANSKSNGIKFKAEPRFKKYATAPSKPETFSEPSVQYFGRTRKTNIFAPVKALFNPEGRNKSKKEKPHYVDYYDKPDLWGTKAVCGVIKPLSVIESRSRRELFDVMIPAVQEDEAGPTAKGRRHRAASSKIRPLGLRTQPSLERQFAKNLLGSTAGSRSVPGPVSGPGSVPASPAMPMSRPGSSGPTFLQEVGEGEGREDGEAEAYGGLVAPPLHSPGLRSRPHLHPTSTEAQPHTSRGMTPVEKLRESKANLPKNGFTFPKDSAIELDANTVLYHRVIEPGGGFVVVPILPHEKTQGFVPRGSSLAEMYASTFPRSPMDPQLRCFTPQKSPFATSRSSIDLQSSMVMDDSTLHMSSRPNTMSSSHSSSYFSSSDAMPRGAFASSPIKPLSHCEWKPPVVPGKSALRKKNDEKEMSAFLKMSTMSNAMSSKTVTLPISVMDTHGMSSSP